MYRPPPLHRKEMKLSNLPLRPSTLSSFLRRGFTTTTDIEQSRKSGGISNLAAELGCTLQEAASRAREVEGAILSLGICTEDDESSAGKYGTTALLSSSTGFSNGVISSSPAERGGDGEALDGNKHVGRNLPSDGTQQQQQQQQQQQNQGTRRHHTNPNPPSSTSVTAASLILSSKMLSPWSKRRILTFCKSIDSLLGGGFARSEVTEVVGVPGVGKTQLAMQLCVDARLPREHGGVEGEAIYIDSEGSFSPERCFDMAKALVKHVHESVKRRRMLALSNGMTRSEKQSNSIPPPVPEWFEPETILDGIHVYRVHDEAAQTATIFSLPAFLQQRANRGTPVKIVLIDSIAFHYRSATPNTDYKARTRSLATIAAFMSDLAANFDLAVVAINQMTTKLGAGGSRPSSSGGGFGGGAVVAGDWDDTRLVPALGESWAHATTTRLLLSHSPVDGTRCCKLVKSPHKAAGTAMYDVTEYGIRDIRPSGNVRNVGRMTTASESSTVAVSKRARTRY